MASKTDTQIYDIDYTQQSLSSTTNNNTPISLPKTKKTKKRKRNTHNKRVVQAQDSPFENKFDTIATPTERKAPSPLILSTQSSEFKHDNSYLSDNDCPKIDLLTNDVLDEAINLEESRSNTDINLDESRSNTDINLEESCSNTDNKLEEQGDDTKLVCNQSLGESLNPMDHVKLFMDELKGEFIKRFERLEEKIEHVDKRVNKKIDLLSQKIDNIHETNATQSILNRLRADHNLDVPYMPTNRTFNENYSTSMKALFNRFQKYLKDNYEHLWTKNHRDVFISIKPQQIEFDVLGFGFEYSSNERTLIESPNLEAISAPSSYTYLKPLKANTVILAEVTTSFLTFHNDDLLIFEKKNISSNQINTERRKSTFKLMQKLLQLERGLGFILLYYKIELEHTLVILYGRFNDSKNHRSPQYIYQLVFESSFSKNIPLLHKLYLRDRNEKNKQIYFIC